MPTLADFRNSCPDAGEEDPNYGVSLDIVHAAITNQTSRIIEDTCLDNSLPLDWTSAYRTVWNDRHWHRRDIVLLASNFSQHVNDYVGALGYHRNDFDDQTAEASIAAVAELTRRLFGTRTHQSDPIALLPCFRMFRMLRQHTPPVHWQETDLPSCLQTGYRYTSPVAYGGVSGIGATTWMDRSGLTTLRSPFMGDCLCFSYGHAGDIRTVRVTQIGVMVETSIMQDSSRRLIRMGHYSLFGSHPVARIISHDYANALAEICRNFADRNAGIPAIGGRPLSASNARRVGLSRADFNRMLNGSEPDGCDFDSIASRMPSLPTNWRASEAALQIARGIAPAPPRQRAWNWSRIPRDVAQIMEHDLTLHLDEPTDIPNQGQNQNRA